MQGKCCGRTNAAGVASGLFWRQQRPGKGHNCRLNKRTSFTARVVSLSGSKKDHYIRLLGGRA